MSNSNLVTKLNLNDKFWITGVLRMNSSCQAVVDLAVGLYEFGACIVDERVPKQAGLYKETLSQKNKTEI